jgi:putative Flp pilus-assembly TadE/G-like protein
MIALLRRESGQTMVMAAIFMVVLLGMAGMVLDVGSWFRQQRVSQATVDSAALAGAQKLPTDPTAARALASSFAAKNGGVAGATFTVSSKWTPNDMITVTQSGSGAGFFSRLFGVSTVTVHAHASAITEIPTEVTGVAPIAVDIKHPMLSGPGCPCFNVPTQIPLGKKGVPGAFGLIDLNQEDNGNAGSSTLADWVTSGYDSYLPLGSYDSDPGAKFDSSQIQGALVSRYGTDLLFPVYDAINGQGSNALYHIIGWVSFHITLTQAHGNEGTLTGYFDRVIWDGIVSSTGPSNPAIPDLGVYSVALID